MIYINLFRYFYQEFFRFVTEENTEEDEDWKEKGREREGDRAMKGEGGRERERLGGDIGMEGEGGR